MLRQHATRWAGVRAGKMLMHACIIASTTMPHLLTVRKRVHVYPLESFPSQSLPPANPPPCRASACATLYSTVAPCSLPSHRLACPTSPSQIPDPPNSPILYKHRYIDQQLATFHRHRQERARARTSVHTYRKCQIWGQAHVPGKGDRKQGCEGFLALTVKEKKGGNKHRGTDLT